MSLGTAVTLLQGSILQTFILSGPILLIGMAVGLIIAILQATTSIQEQTLTFVPKIAAILTGLALLGPWMAKSLMDYTVRLFRMIPSMNG
jgi:flagellar biosynthesis protein FliQ